MPRQCSLGQRQVLHLGRNLRITFLNDGFHHQTGALDDGHRRMLDTHRGLSSRPVSPLNLQVSRSKAICPPLTAFECKLSLQCCPLSNACEMAMCTCCRLANIRESKMEQTDERITASFFCPTVGQGGGIISNINLIDLSIINGLLKTSDG